MMNPASRIVHNEEPVSNCINVISHYDDATLLDKGGKLIQVIRLKGLDCISHDARELDTYKNRINNLLKGFSSEFALYCWDMRKRVADFPDGHFSAGYASELNDRYRNKIHSAMMFRNDLYLAIITKQPEGLINRSFSFLQQFNQRLDKSQHDHYLARKHDELCEMSRKVMSAMSDYGCELLSVYEKNGIKFSAPLEFISQIINVDTHSVILTSEDVDQLWPRKRLCFNNRAGTVEFRATDGKSRFAAMLAIKGYSPYTSQGMLDDLSRLKCEYLITQSYRFYDRQVAKTKLRDQQSEMLQSHEESISQTEQLDDSFDDAASGEVGFGLHHLTLACYADSLDELNRHVGTITSRFADLDITCVREEVGCECAFWLQLPGNFRYDLRSATISTRNMAGLASFHNYHLGKLKGNHWGDAVTVFETLAGTPYYFNFHHKDVGNFLVFGAMGSGKTLLIGFLIAQSMKFGGKRVIFDKDRGLEIFVRAMGGTYERIKPGIPTGFNPCQLDDTAENRAFLAALLRRMLTINNESLSAADHEVIGHAIDGIYRMEKQDRQLCHMAPFFLARKAGSLRNRFDQWHSDGQYAWLFDNRDDSLNLECDVLGFDLGSILNDSDCKIPALMYLTYRVEQAMAGQRGFIFYDEGWQIINDPDLQKDVNDRGRTSRKKDNIVGLATQVANDTADSSVSRAVNESAFCKIFFPNPSADRSVYMDSFGLTEHEYHLVKSLPDDQFYFLLIHGHGVNKESVVVRPDLSGMHDDIAIISARESSLAILDKIRSEVGDDPDDWLPIFKSQMRSLA
jgi:type IV secretion system protein VirB4